MITIRSLSLLASILFSILYPAQYISASNIFSFRINGGVAYIIGGDINRGLEGQANTNIDLAKLFDYDIKGSFSAAHLGFDINTELLFQLSPRFGIGGGYGFGKVSNKSTLTFSNSYEAVIQILSPEIEFTSYFAEVFYTLPISNKLNAFISIGAGKYGTSAKSYSSLESGGLRTEIQTDSSAANLGYIGELSIEWRLSRAFGLMFGFAGRYGKLTDFKGSSTESSGSMSMTSTGILYYFEQENWSNGRFYPNLTIFDTSVTPIESLNLTNPRKAIIDISGGILRLSLRIYL